MQEINSIINTFRTNIIFSNSLLPAEKPVGPNQIFVRWRKFATNNGIKDRTIYNLKHNAAGRLIEAGFNARDIQMHFRHSSLNQTEIYMKKFTNSSSERLKHNFPSLKADKNEDIKDEKSATKSATKSHFRGKKGNNSDNIEKS